MFIIARGTHGRTRATGAAGDGQKFFVSDDVVFLLHLQAYTIQQFIGSAPNKAEPQKRHLANTLIKRSLVGRLQLWPFSGLSGPMDSLVAEEASFFSRMRSEGFSFNFGSLRVELCSLVVVRACSQPSSSVRIRALWHCRWGEL